VASGDSAVPNTMLGEAFYNELLLMTPRTEVLSSMLANVSGTQLLAHKV